ncbi:hypothetical protein Mapa_003751 [Marchantia paleacea]|nr:hypothetical protein Mapa_003751 [Marchantia paleacea]
MYNLHWLLNHVVNGARLASAESGGGMSVRSHSFAVSKGRRSRSRSSGSAAPLGVQSVRVSGRPSAGPVPSKALTSEGAPYAFRIYRARGEVRLYWRKRVGESVGLCAASFGARFLPCSGGFSVEAIVLPRKDCGSMGESSSPSSSKSDDEHHRVKARHHQKRRRRDRHEKHEKHEKRNLATNEASISGRSSSSSDDSDSDRKSDADSLSSGGRREKKRHVKRKRRDGTSSQDSDVENERHRKHRRKSRTHKKDKDKDKRREKSHRHKERRHRSKELRSATSLLNYCMAGSLLLAILRNSAVDGFV